MALTEFSDSDVLFLVETVDPQLVGKIEILKGDPSIIEHMLDHEADKLFERIMLMSEERIMTQITPRFLFEVLLRRARRELESQSYTVERSATQRIPVFDTKEVVQFLDNKPVLKYLADMLSSFTKVESFTLPVRVRKNVWRKVRFSDMDIDSLARFCQVIDEEHRFGFYKRIADLCLFILGMFPEYVTSDLYYPFRKRPKFFGRLRRSAEDYEEEGRRFYKLAGEHRNAATFHLAEILWQLHEKFNLAKKPLNYISENLLRFRKQRLFPLLPPN
jgi:hypothetical protein